MSDSEEFLLLQNQLTQHILYCEKRFDEGNGQFVQLLSCQEQNTKVVKELSEKIDPVVECYRDIQGVTRIGVGVRNFGLWLVSIPVVGGVLFAGYHWAIDNIALFGDMKP